MHTLSLAFAAMLVLPGVLLLVSGVELYDTLIMLIGFFIGAGLASTGVTTLGLTGTTTELAASVLIILIIGIIAAFIAITFHNLLIVGLGFLGGAAVGLILLQGAGVPATPTGAFVGGASPTGADIAGIIALVIGGILGASLGWILFRGIVILFTSIIGAGLITLGIDTAMHEPGDTMAFPDLLAQPELIMQDGLLFLGLVLFGIIVQGLNALRTRREEQRAAARSRRTRR